MSDEDEGEEEPYPVDHAEEKAEGTTYDPVSSSESLDEEPTSESLDEEPATEEHELDIEPPDDRRSDA